MAKKKKLAGQINFYKAMTVLGALLAGVLIYGFFGSAPDLRAHSFHDATDPPEKCIACHVVQSQNTPIMPHRAMDTCTFCHTPESKQP